MGRDRLGELRQRANLSEGEGDACGNNVDGNSVGYSAVDGAVIIEMQSKQFNMEKFFDQVEHIRSLIVELKADVAKVKTVHTDLLSTPNPDEKKKQDLDKLMACIKTNSQQVIRAKLKDMEESIKKEESETQKDETPASLRIMKTQHSALLREFVSIMNDYQQAQVDYRDRCKARIKRQLNIIDETNVSDDEIENMLEDGKFTVFTQGILMQSEQARQTLADVEARHKDILKLEKSLKELHDLFCEMAIMVEQQGEVIDRIETQVMSTKDYTEKAREQLVQAQQLQTAARKKKIWIVIVIIIILLVLGLVIYFSV